MSESGCWAPMYDRRTGRLIIDLAPLGWLLIAYSIGAIGLVLSVLAVISKLTRPPRRREGTWVALVAVLVSVLTAILSLVMLPSFRGIFVLPASSCIIACVALTVGRNVVCPAVGHLTGAFAGLKVVGSAWCLFELRKWRATPEFWALDWIDTVFRIQTVFGVRLTATDFQDWTAAERADLTAGQLWNVIVRKLPEANTPIPIEGWQLLAAALSAALCVPTNRISTESRLYADLDMIYGRE